MISEYEIKLAVLKRQVDEMLITHEFPSDTASAFMRGGQFYLALLLEQLEENKNED
jgi:hypothetical protein